MSLREAVADIRNKRLGTIAGGFFRPRTALSDVVRHLAAIESAIELPRTTRIDEVAGKVARCLEITSCASLDRRDWRIVPWVMWKGPCAAEHNWFLDALFAVIAFDRPTSVVRALIHAYIANFEAERESCVKVASFLRQQFSLHDFGSLSRWQSIDRRFCIFDPSVGPRSVGSHALDADDLYGALAEAGIPRDRVDDPLSERAFDFAVEAVARRLRAPNQNDLVQRAVDRLFTWNTNEAGKARYIGSVVPMATDLLEALEDSRITEDLQDQIVRYFVKELGDPRLSKARWHSVSSTALDVAMRLLVRSTLEDFFRIIDAVAQARMWDERKAFWLSYYEAGAISDAWVAFGPRAASRAQALEKRYGTLVGAMEKSHSALIMRMNDLIIVEMSHNGRCRFYPAANDRWRPGCYDKRYDFQELRDNCDDYGDALTHMGNWPPRFAGTIYDFTGTRHPQYGSGHRW